MKARFIVSVVLVLLSVIQTHHVHAQSKLLTLLPSKQTGVHFSNQISESEGLNVLAYEYFFNGAGVAVGDLNNDGLQDLFFTANMKSNALFQNLGNLKFKDITYQAGESLAGRPGHWKTGVTMADVNNDGLLDIYVCYSGKGEPDTRRNELFINLGNMKFKEAAKEYGLDDPSYSTQAAFFDYDLDGDLDMFLLNHSTKKVDNLEFAKYRSQVDEFAGCKMYENDGKRFHDVSSAVGISRSALTFGLGVVVADINLDGWPDLYVTNDYNEPDHLYINTKQRSFSDKADFALSHMSQFSMGADIADYNNDGLPDIMTLDMLPEDNKRQKLLQLQENYEIFELMQQQGLHRQYMRNMLHLNNGDGTFSEIAQLAGVSNTDWSWTPLFADFDNDGFKDLYITNGYLRDYTNKDFLKYWGDYKVKKAIEREPVQLMDLIKAMPATKIPNYIFKNNQDLSFSNKQVEWGTEQPVISSGAVYADLDNDGDLELVVNNVNEEAFIYQNNTQELNKQHYIDIQLSDPSNKSVAGTRVQLFANGKMQMQELNPNRGYLSAVTTRLHFGLGEEKQVDSIHVFWPGDSFLDTILYGVDVDRVLIIRDEGQGTGDKGTAEPTTRNPQHTTGTRDEGQGTRELTTHNSKPIFTSIPSPISYTHKSFGENDFKRQLLMLFMYSNTGPVLAKADINKDGLDDVFVSGNAQQSGQIWMQQQNGSFQPLTGLNIVNEEESAVAAACFADFNNDSWPDLYIAKGGYSIWMPNTAALQDEIYLNDGKGNLQKTSGLLPDLSSSSKSCVRPADVDGDGDTDLFVGGRIIPGRYPVTPESFLLINDGKGKFSKKSIPFDRLGMITDAQWADLNKDGRLDMVLVGEFMPITVYLNLKDGFEAATETYFDQPMSGFWSSLLLKDFNNDGQIDILAGNIGKNTPFKISPKEPAEMHYADFDDNGSIDPFFTYYIQGKSYPYVSRDEINEQIYAMRKKFLSYEQYANATLKDIFTQTELDKAITLQVDHQETLLFTLENGKYKSSSKLPIEAQFSMVRNTVADDFDGDGKEDLLLMGNQSQNRLKMGAIQANRGCLLVKKGDLHFQYINQLVSGLNITGDVKSALTLKSNGKNILLVGATDQPLQAYSY